jgi:lysophospholipase L1-like esterase
MKAMQRHAARRGRRFAGAIGKIARLHGTIVVVCATTIAISPAVASASPVCRAAPSSGVAPVEEMTSGGPQSTIPDGVQLAVLPSDNISLIGGQQLSPDQSDPAAYKFSWKYQPPSFGPIGYPSPRGWGVQFGVTGTKEIEFHVYARPAAAWNLTVDGKHAWAVPQTTPLVENSDNTIKFTLPDPRQHTVRFYMNNLSLSSVFGDSGSKIIARPIGGPRVFFLGDSLTQGGKQSTGGELGSWIWQFADQCGFGDVWNGGLGSTGALADGDMANYVTRAATDVAPANPALVFISSYFNDYHFVPSDIANAFASAIDIVRNLPSKPAVVVMGSFDPQGENQAPFDAIDPAIRDVCVQRGVPYIEPRTGLAYDGRGRPVTPSGDTGPWITQANRQQYVGSDGVHQTDAGQAYMAERVYESYRAIS